MSKKKASKPKEGNALGPKSRGLFDHINAIREQRNPKYFDTLTDLDKKSWSNYMICRFLSMQQDIVDEINEVQKYGGVLAPKDFYRLLLEVVPRGRGYYPYVKSKSDIKWSKELMELLRTHYQESERNVIEYLNLLTPDELKQVVSLYGFTDKEIKKLLDNEK